MRETYVGNSERIWIESAVPVWRCQYVHGDDVAKKLFHGALVLSTLQMRVNAVNARYDEGDALPKSQDLPASSRRFMSLEEVFQCEIVRRLHDEIQGVAIGEATKTSYKARHRVVI